MSSEAPSSQDTPVPLPTMPTQCFLRCFPGPWLLPLYSLSGLTHNHGFCGQWAGLCFCPRHPCRDAHPWPCGLPETPLGTLDAVGPNLNSFIFLLPKSAYLPFSFTSGNGSTTHPMPKPAFFLASYFYPSGSGPHHLLLGLVQWHPYYYRSLFYTT